MHDIFPTRRLVPALLATLIATTAAQSQEVDRWRYYADPTGSQFSVAYGGTEGEDTWVVLECVYQGVRPEISAYIVAHTEGLAEGQRTDLLFYGPNWQVLMPVVVDPPGLYESVSARISFTPGDQVFRSVFDNVDAVNLRVLSSTQPEVHDFSNGRADVVRFMTNCEHSGASTGVSGEVGGELQP